MLWPTSKILRTSCILVDLRSTTHPLCNFDTQGNASCIDLYHMFNTTTLLFNFLYSATSQAETHVLSQLHWTSCKVTHFPSHLHPSSHTWTHACTLTAHYNASTFWWILQMTKAHQPQCDLWMIMAVCWLTFRSFFLILRSWPFRHNTSHMGVSSWRASQTHSKSTSLLQCL